MHEAAYVAREKIREEQRDHLYDYSRRQDLTHAEIMLPKGVPDEYKDRAMLWNAACSAEVTKKGELRKNARWGRHVEIALPIELSRDEQIALVREYVQRNFVSKGVAADFAIHQSHESTKEKNPHAHILVSARDLTAEGFGKKDRTWNEKGRLLQWRESWAEIANEHLARLGHQVRIDHRSYIAQGVDLIPGIHLGSAPGEDRQAQMERLQRENAQRIVEDPAIALRAITNQQAIFSEHHLGRWVLMHTADMDDHRRVLSAVKNSPELVHLEDGRFTSHEMVQVELGVVWSAERLDRGTSTTVPERFVEQALKADRLLSEEQRVMVRYLANSGNLAVVEGAAGTGKSRGLRAAREAWESAGHRVVGAALAGRAAEELTASAGISARSLASWEARWRLGRDHLGKGDVLVVDEAGMVGSRQMRRLLVEVDRRGAKIVLTGDTKQIPSIEAGAALRLIAERNPSFELRAVRRQVHQWQIDANNEIHHGDARKGLLAYADQGCVSAHENRAAALEQMAATWNAKRHDGDGCVMFAHENADVAALNRLAREYRSRAGELGEDQVLATAKGRQAFAVGDRIVFDAPNKDLGVVNGTEGMIRQIQGDTVVARVGERDVAWSLKDYAAISPAYAVNLHKGQGRSIDHAVVLASAHMDRGLAYVGMSRQRQSVEMHYDLEAFADKNALVRSLVKVDERENVLDRIQLSPEEQARAVRTLAKETQGQGGAQVDGKIAKVAQMQDQERKKQRHAPRCEVAQQIEISGQQREADDRLITTYLRLGSIARTEPHTPQSIWNQREDVQAAKSRLEAYTRGLHTARRALDTFDKQNKGVMRRWVNRDERVALEQAVRNVEAKCDQAQSSWQGLKGNKSVAQECVEFAKVRNRLREKAISERSKLQPEYNRAIERRAQMRLQQRVRDRDKEQKHEISGPGVGRGRGRGFEF